MRRQDFGAWGLQLSDQDFARALAALGVLRHAPDCWPPGDDPQAVVDRLYVLAPDPDALVVWQLGTTADLRENPDAARASTLADAWSLVQGYHFAPRLEIRGFESRDPSWLVEQLSSYSVSAESVYVRVDDPSVDVVWEWPLRVGFLKDKASDELLRRIAVYPNRPDWMNKLIRPVTLRRGHESCDLLLLPYDLENALATMLTYPVSVIADCTLVLGTSTESAERSYKLLQGLRATVRTSGVGLVPVRDRSVESWLEELVAELSHNQTIDVALYRACRNMTKHAPLLTAARKLIEFATLARRVRMLGERMVGSAMKRKSIKISADSATFRTLNIEPGRHKASMLGERLLETADDAGYMHESEMASAAVELTEVVHRSRKSKSREEVTPRYIQACIFERDGKKRKGALTTAFRKNTLHDVDVMIGVRKAGWIVPSLGKKFPISELPPGLQEYELTMVFTEPNLLPQPQVHTVILPRFGDSSSCTFQLPVNDAAESVAARIAVLYGNRVLQTAIVRGEVVADPAQATAEKIELDIEAIVRPDVGDLSRHSSFNSALILDRTEDGDMSATDICDNVAGIWKIGGLQQEMSWLDNELTDIAYSAAQKQAGLKSQVTVDLLREFASHGRMLYERVLRSCPNTRAFNGERIHLLAANEDARLPIETFYEFRSPDPDAQLCENAETALRDGKCPSSCAANRDQRKVICPMAFMGISRIVERHVSRPDRTGQLQGRDFLLSSVPLAEDSDLKILTEGLVGGCDIVEKKCPGDLEKLRQNLATATGKATTLASSWQEWQDGVARGNPSFLLLVVHTEPVNLGSTMQKMKLGIDSWLNASSLDERYIGPEDRRPRPTVILLGCRTDNRDVPSLGFEARLMEYKAAIVVSTGSKIHATQAVPIARELVERLSELPTTGTKTFGEIMRSLRRKLLAKGLPTVLCLTAYGDADWRLVRARK